MIRMYQDKVVEGLAAKAGRASQGENLIDSKKYRGFLFSLEGIWVFKPQSTALVRKQLG
jgi:hypothetical protein